MHSRLRDFSDSFINRKDPCHTYSIQRKKSLQKRLFDYLKARCHWHRAFQLHRAFAPLSASGFLFLFTLDAGLLIVLALADLRQNAGAGAFTLKPLQCALQRFVFAHTNFRHSLTPPSIEGLHRRRGPRTCDLRKYIGFYRPCQELFPQPQGKSRRYNPYKPCVTFYRRMCLHFVLPHTVSIRIFTIYSMHQYEFG